MNEESVNDKHIFGFWIYLMTDLIMFAALFAVFAVLRSAIPFSLNGALAETVILLTSSFTCGLAMLAVHEEKLNQAIAWFAATFILGAAFLAFELAEFAAFAAAGNGPQASGSLSAFFTLVGTHGLHIAVGLLWMMVAMIQLKRRANAGGTLSPSLVSKLDRLALFWHFLDIIWIFIFTIVYLMGVAL